MSEQNNQTLSSLIETSEFVYHGSTISNNPNIKKPKPIGVLNRDNLKYDEKRDMYYQGEELSKFMES